MRSIVVGCVLSGSLLAGLAGCEGPVDGKDPVKGHTAALGTEASTWTPLVNAPPGFLDNCNLLTDGTVACHEYNTNRWRALRPDAFGSYANGTWDSPAIAPMPNGNDPGFGCTNCTYSPLYFSSALLPDGRMVVIGGEYVNLTPVWTNIGFIYDPFTNTWSTQLNEAFGSGSIGDAMGTVLANGTYVLTNIFNGNLEALNPTTLAFTALNPTGKLDANNEEGLNILYDGTLLAVNSRIVSSFERYNPMTNTWGNSGSTGVNLADTGGLPVGNSAEVGSGVLRPDGALVYFSGNSLGQNAIYDTAANTWSNTSAMDFPLVPGQTYHYAQADGTSSLLPNGNVLAMASPVINGSPFNSPSHFYEMRFSDNTLIPVTDSPNAASFAAYQGRMILLPTGEVLLTAYNQGATQDVMLYSNGGAPQDAWRPTVSPCPTTVSPGNTYSISGTLFNGFSEGAFYGDDAQSSTNYPLVRITNNATGHVFYARTHNHSRMGVERVGSTEVVTTQFDAPAGMEAGPSTLVVVTNGIPSLGCPINQVTNNPPVAKCKAVSVFANATCQAAASINDGSFDPDGDPFTCVQAPPSPYGKGNTTVTLTCTDNKGAQGSCSSVVSVVDNTPPSITAPPNVTISVCVGANIGTPVASDNCGAPTITNNAPAKFPLGATTVTWTATDAAGNFKKVTQTVTAVLGDSPTCCPTGTNIIEGDSSSNQLVGTSGSDCILGKGGDDVIDARDGNDYISGGAGRDTIFAGNGNDRVYGNDGDDTIDVRPGINFVDGGNGTDTCAVTPGSDTVLSCNP